ncbi:MAG: TRAP transporter small permease [Hyphomicrobiales bacterium]
MAVPSDASGQSSSDGSPTLGPFAERLRRFAEWVARAMFALVFLIFNYKIATRYIGREEAVWADEVSVILFIWIIFWANALLLRDKQQITFDLCYRPLPDGAKRVFSLARHLLIGGIFVAALPGSLDYILFLWRERTPVLGLPLDLVYSCFGLFLAAVIARSCFAAAKLLGPKWRMQL